MVCDSRRVATEYVCPHPYIYIQSRRLCGRSYDLNTCPLIDCNANKNTFIRYEPEPQLYYFCSERGPVLLQCNYGQAFYNETLSCEFACQREGRFPHDTDVDKYYYCLYDGTYSKFNRFVETCPEGQFFSSDSQVCVFRREGEVATWSETATQSETTSGTWYP